MKKVIVAALAGLLMSAAAFADGITLGARGLYGLNVGTSVEDADLDTVFGDFGVALFGKFALPVLDGKLAIQPELGFTHYDVVAKESGWSCDIEFNTFDIPVLVVYDILVNDSITVSPLAGVKFSIPVGDVDIMGFSGSADSKVLVGIDFGASLYWKVGPGALVVDARYDLGVTKLKVEDADLLTPRSLISSIGYSIQL